MFRHFVAATAAAARNKSHVGRVILNRRFCAWRGQATLVKDAVNNDPNDNSKHHPCSNDIVVCIAATAVDYVPKVASGGNDALSMVTLN